MPLSAAELAKHRRRQVSEADFDEHRWEVALHNERDALRNRKGTNQEKGNEDRRIAEITAIIGDGRKEARTAQRGDAAEERGDS